MFKILIYIVNHIFSKKVNHFNNFKLYKKKILNNTTILKIQNLIVEIQLYWKFKI